MPVRFAVVSLATADERRAFVREQFASRSLDWRFFDARTEIGTDLVNDPEEQLVYLRRTMAPSETATFASHFHLLKSIAEDRFSGITVVLEDDVYVDPYFDFASLASFQSALGIDYLRLYSRAMRTFVPVARYGLRSLLRFTRNPYGTQAYAVNRQGAARFLEHVERCLNRHVVRPIDEELDRFGDHGLLPYALYPYPVLELGFASQIRAPDEIYRKVPRSMKQMSRMATDRLNRFQANRAAILSDRKLQQLAKTWETTIEDRYSINIRSSSKLPSRLAAPDGSEPFGLDHG